MGHGGYLVPEMLYGGKTSSILSDSGFPLLLYAHYPFQILCTHIQILSNSHIMLVVYSYIEKG